jgi:hypothetical protein
MDSMQAYPAILADNAAQLHRLQTLVARFGTRDRDLSGGWTVGVALAHLAFWDRRAVHLLDHWREHGVAANDHPDDDILNTVLLDEWRALPFLKSGELAVEAANAVNFLVEKLDTKTVEAIMSCGDDWLLRRGRHRREHLDQIDRVFHRANLLQ